MKYGCFGCLGIVDSVVLAGAVMVGIAANQAGSENIVDDVLTPALPITPDAAPAAGFVTLDLREADSRSSPLHRAPLCASRPATRTARTVLEERTEENPDGTWSYHMSFKRGGSWLMTALKQAMGGTSPQVRIYLPPDIPLSLEIELHQGGAQVELGGLLARLGRRLARHGGHAAQRRGTVARPDGAAVDLRVDGRPADDSLGNASPSELDVDFSMGGLVLDLRGEWTTNGRVTIGSSMGGWRAAAARRRLDRRARGSRPAVSGGARDRNPLQADVRRRSRSDDWRVVP